MNNKQIRELQPQIGRIYYAAEYPVETHEVVTEFSDFEFLIALTTLKNRKYKALFQERDESRYRIVDSGVFEDPENVPSAAKQVEVALELGADEVVMLDRIGDRDGTLKCAEEFLSLSDNFPFKIMAVPQGEDFHEWYQCYKEFVDNPRIDVIGITYHKHPAGLEQVGVNNFGIPNPLEAARLALIHQLAGGLSCEFQGAMSTMPVQLTVGTLIRKPIHILGCGHLRALKYYCQLPFVRSIDTSFPVQLAVEGRALHMDSVKSAFKINFSANLNRAQLALVAANVLRFSQLCRGQGELDAWAVVDRLVSVRSEGG